MGQEWVRERGTQERQQTGGGATQTHRTREPHHEGQGRAQQTSRRGTVRQERQPEQREQGTRMEGMGEPAHGRQRQQKGWPGQPAPLLPGARATPAPPASGGGCLPWPRWAVCAAGAGAHQGQTSREGEKDIWWTAGTTHGGTGHLGLTHTETQRGRLWTACGQRRVDSKNNSQTTPATTSTSSIRQLLGAADAQTAHMPHSAHPQHTNYWAPRTRQRHQQEHRPQRPTENSNPTQHAKGRTGDCPGPRKETTTRRNVTQGVGPTHPPPLDPSTHHPLPPKRSPGVGCGSAMGPSSGSQQRPVTFLGDRRNWDLPACSNVKHNSTANGRFLVISLMVPLQGPLSVVCICVVSARGVACTVRLACAFCTVLVRLVVCWRGWHCAPGVPPSMTSAQGGTGKLGGFLRAQNVFCAHNSSAFQVSPCMKHTKGGSQAWCARGACSGGVPRAHTPSLEGTPPPLRKHCLV